MCVLCCKVSSRPRTISLGQRHKPPPPPPSTASDHTLQAHWHTNGMDGQAVRPDLNPNLFIRATSKEPGTWHWLLCAIDLPDTELVCCIIVPQACWISHEWLMKVGRLVACMCVLYCTVQLFRDLMVRPAGFACALPRSLFHTYLPADILARPLGRNMSQLHHLGAFPALTPAWNIERLVNKTQNGDKAPGWIR